MMAKRPNRRASQEDLAADRQREQQSYPSNNFAVSGLILAVLIVVIGLAIALGLVKP